MANYLPVLLVSVSTNVIPDDSSLSTLPRGQVDYLSHNWKEEDVWLSWRSMTRQKNEIANGMRLENASWRTWWKQRNKLKTISPETLNWLKDSDVTWLYGPLHTAVEWTPPPRPPPIETEHKTSSAQDRLDLSEPKHKSILKYRSISELLTSDLHSPLFSPAESENEADDRHKHHFKHVSDDSVDAETLSSHSKRPALPYTKSDTHIERWGPDRSFRKDSPPRIGPPEASTSSNLSPSNQCSNGSSNGGDQSSSNSTSPSPREHPSELSGNVSQNHSHKKKHITFNTFVEQCIAIEKPKPKGKLGALGLGGFENGDEWYNGTEVHAGYDDGYDEDGEDGFGHDGDWGLDECAVGTDSDSDCNTENVFLQDEEENGEDSAIEMHASRINNSKRSQSKSSDSSSGDSYSSSSNKPYSKTPRKSIPSASRRRRRSDLTRADLPRRKSSSSGPSSSEKDLHHVTIAPIAPTILKTGNSSWDGFGVHSPYQRGNGSGAWMESFGDDGYSDDGGVGPKLLDNKKDNDNDGINAPLDLVYMPPTARYGGSGHGSRVSSPANNSPGASASTVAEDSSTKVEKENGVVEESAENGDKVYRHQQAYFSLDDVLSHPEGTSKVPIVVKTPPAVDRGGGSDDEAEEDAYDYFGGPDLGGDYSAKRTSLRRKDRTTNNVDNTSGDNLSRNNSNLSPDNDGDKVRRNKYRDDEPRRSRSRSRSRSRTPSPVYVPTSSTPAISVPSRATSPPQVPTSSSLLSPPSRGSPQLPQSSLRGRSSTRSSPSSLSDRERSNHGSPLGSLSPEGSAIGIAFGAYANGRGGGDREPESQRGRRDGERGRDRTGRSLSHSLSPDVFGSVPTSPNLSPSRSLLLGEGNSQILPRAPSSSVPAASTVSSSPSSVEQQEKQQASNSSSSSASPSSPSSAIPIPPEVRDEDEMRSILTPTPANSPIISMSGAARKIAEMDGKMIDKEKEKDNKDQTDSSSSKASLPPPLNLSGPKLPSATPTPSPPIVHTRTASGSLQSKNNNREKEVSGREQGTGDDGIVGKFMSSAGAYLGLWNNGTATVQ
ncbi:hypothetical protein K435DRAFT_792506 [Dendrothele bispora CBS 962.96]|uniref:Nitrogen regulatory protein areA GATA-like domain-containing protein n=1 Tax=Dendrothele bispora (strain CBS 962.96) TaxID=1314807 RepID=A0A4S8MIF9_DENBC|nr:hypothetical protein K435DRAFT_792506 [Dendrothele bispora CBS 962.96]